MRNIRNYAINNYYKNEATITTTVTSGTVESGDGGGAAVTRCRIPNLGQLFCAIRSSDVRNLISAATLHEYFVQQLKKFC